MKYFYCFPKSLLNGKELSVEYSLFKGICDIEAIFFFVVILGIFQNNYIFYNIFEIFLCCRRGDSRAILQTFGWLHCNFVEYLGTIKLSNSVKTLI